MLERIQPEIGEVGGLGITENSEDAAFVLEFIEHEFAKLSRALGACGEYLYSTLPCP